LDEHQPLGLRVVGPGLAAGLGVAGRVAAVAGGVVAVVALLVAVDPAVAARGAAGRVEAGRGGAVGQAGAVVVLALVADRDGGAAGQVDHAARRAGERPRLEAQRLAGLAAQVGAVAVLGAGRHAVAAARRGRVGRARARAAAAARPDQHDEAYGRARHRVI